MIRATIHLPFYRLQIRLDKSRAKAQGTSLLSSLSSLKNVRSGNKASRFFRHILERVNIKSFLGGNLALFVVVSSVITPGAAALTQADPEVTTLTIAEQPISTQVSIQFPINQVVLNQGFHFLHWGIDLDGVTGDPIHPIMKGKVIKTDYSRFAYGNSILIDHENGYQSLYAHLSQINVREGDETDTRSTIGKMGSTGRSTGDHLHLEIYKDGRPVNPLSILPR